MKYSYNWRYCATVLAEITDTSGLLVLNPLSIQYQTTGI